MRERLEQRVAALKSEFDNGQQLLAEMEAKHARLRESLLRISGAIQVLEEELARAEEAEPARVARLAPAAPSAA